MESSTLSFNTKVSKLQIKAAFNVEDKWTVEVVQGKRLTNLNFYDCLELATVDKTYQNFMDYSESMDITVVPKVKKATIKYEVYTPFKNRVCFNFTQNEAPAIRKVFQAILNMQLAHGLVVGEEAKKKTVLKHLN